MQKVLILGGEGMLGHKAYQVFSRDVDTYATFLSFDDRLRKTGIYDEKKIIDKINVLDLDLLRKVFRDLKPDVVMNCIGIIKQVKEVKNPKIAIYINSLFPHLLAECSAQYPFKLVHISTDCVFSGKKGNYLEGDFADAEDLYGRTKYLGEVEYGESLTLRTSIIGRELFTNVSLVDWFLSQENRTVNGFVHAIYTGLTTIAFCKEVKRILTEHPSLSGLFHLSADKISKFDLLHIIKDVYKLNIIIKPQLDFQCDRSLDSTRYRKETNFIPPPWQEMIEEMYKDQTPYSKWRSHDSH